MSIFFGVLFADAKLFANAYLQIIYVALGIWGRGAGGGAGRAAP